MDIFQFANKILIQWIYTSLMILYTFTKCLF